MAESGNLTPKTVADYLRLAWEQHAIDGQPGPAADNFRQAIRIDPQNVDAHYGLGLTLKAQGSREEAVQAFRKAVELIEGGVIPDHDRSEMLHRLAIAHINRLQQGDWNLEKEIWRKSR